MRPPIAIRPGIFSSHTTTTVSALRTTIAPSAPKKIARLRRWTGTLRADHDGIVARKHQVDDDDGCQRVEEVGRQEFHG